MRESVKAREIMRRTLLLMMSLIIAAVLSGCGTTGPQTSVGNANQNTSNAGPTTTNSGGSAGSGPQNQGIGGTSDSSANRATVNGNTRVNPPGPIGGGSAGNSRP